MIVDMPHCFVNQLGSIFIGSSVFVHASEAVVLSSEIALHMTGIVHTPAKIRSGVDWAQLLVHTYHHPNILSRL